MSRPFACGGNIGPQTNPEIKKISLAKPARWWYTILVVFASVAQWQRN